MWRPPLDTKSLTWGTIDDYPLYKGVTYAANVASQGNFFIFGGYNYYDGILSAVARYQESWKKVGELLKPRYMHGVIVMKDEFYVIGGMTLNDGLTGAAEHFWFFNFQNLIPFVKSSVR